MKDGTYTEWIHAWFRRAVRSTPRDERVVHMQHRRGRVAQLVSEIGGTTFDERWKRGAPAVRKSTRAADDVLGGLCTPLTSRGAIGEGAGDDYYVVLGSLLDPDVGTFSKPFPSSDRAITVFGFRALTRGGRP